MIVVTEALTGMRLDAALARLLPEYSRSRLQDWVREGRVTRDGRLLDDPKTRVAAGESLVIREGVEPEAAAFEAEAIPLDIVFEDEALLVIHKPAGLVVHPGSGNWSGTLLNGLLHHDAALREVPRAGIVHRLDKETSGLMVVAKTIPAQTDLVRQLQARSVSRIYAAVVVGETPERGTVEAPIGRHPTQRTRMAVVDSGRPARTHFRRIEALAGASLVECSLETGRTHQIRVHMTHIGHPLVGDPVYGGRRTALPGAGDFPRQALHAFRLGLLHPLTHAPMQWEIPLAEDLAALVARLHRH